MSADLPKKKKLIPVSEAAKMLGVSIDTVRRWDRKGILHSQRPDGKNRFFSLDELEKVKFAQPLPISNASQYLGISTSTLRRIEARGLIKPERNEAGERIYTKQSLERFLKSEYFLRQKKIEEKILEPFNKEAESHSNGYANEPKESPTHKVLNILQEETREEVSRLAQFQKILSVSGLFLATTFTLLVILIAVLFLLFPEDTGSFFGYRTNRSLAGALNTVIADKNSGKQSKTESEVLGVQYSPKPQSQENGEVLGAIFKPVSNISLSIVKQISPQTYEKVIPRVVIEDVNDIFTIDDQGNISPLYNIKFPESSYIQIPDSNQIDNLNASYLRGKSVSSEAGQIAVIKDDGTISNLVINKQNIPAGAISGGTGGVIAGLSITGAELANASISTEKIADGAVTAAKLASGLAVLGTDTVITSYIKDGAVANSKLGNSSITFAADSGTSSSSSLGDTRTIAGGGIIATSISGGTITITGTEADTLASVTARGATTTTAVTFGQMTATNFNADTFNGLAIINNGTNTLNIAAGKTLATSNSLTLLGTDSTSMTFPSTSATLAGLGITQTFTGVNTFNSNLLFGGSTGILQSNGNVGIGTTAIDYNLRVNGTGYFSGFLGIGSSLSVTGNVGIGASATATSQLTAGSILSDGPLVVSGTSFLQDILGAALTTSGNVGLGASASITSYLSVGSLSSAGPVCLGSDCRTSWPATVTGESTTASNGLTLSAYDVRLGGSLTQATGIDIAGQNFGFLGGNVGIGTSTPDYNLTVNGTGYFSGFVGIGSSMSVAGNVGIGKSLSVSSNLDASSISTSTLSVSGNTTLSTLTTSGNVGIGGTATFNNPAIFNGITNTGAISSTNFLAGNGSATAPSYSFTNLTNAGLWTNGDGLLLTTGGSNTSGITVTGAGRVGIGTTSPAQALDVNGNILMKRYLSMSDTATNNPYIGLFTSSASHYIQSNNGNLQVDAYTSGKQLQLLANGANILIQTRNSGNVILNPAGNVGIGTSTPDYNLTVNGTGYFSGFLGVGSSMSVAGNVGIGGTATISSLLNSNGILNSNGSATAPSYSFTNLTNAGLWTNGDGLLLTTGGSNTSGITVTGAGRVGIGTTSPAASLDVAGSIQIQSSNRLILANASNNGNIWIENNGASGEADLSISTGVTNAFYIRNSGNVGIGTTTANYALDVAGQINASTGFCIAGDCKTTWSGVGGYTASNGLTLSGTDFQLGGSLTQATGIDIAGQNFGFLGGNVGIGTTSSSRLLTLSKSDTTTTLSQARTAVMRINNSGATPGQMGGIQFSHAADSTAEFTSGAIYSILTSTTANSTSDLVFALHASTSSTDLTEYMRIKAGGNVGIGTTGPGYKLEVSGSSYFSSEIKAGTKLSFIDSNTAYTDTSAYPAIYATNTAGAAYPFKENGNLILQARNSSSYPRDILFVTGSSNNISMLVDRYGNVGIGTTNPQASLYVTGNGMIGYSSGGGTSNLANGLAISGSLGIGTSNPQTKLEVQGQAFIDNLSGSNARNLLTLNVNGTNYAHFYNPGALSGSGGGLAIGGSATKTGTPGTPAMFWNVNSGNVGIGTTNPTSSLEILSGDIKINDSSDTARRLFFRRDNADVGFLGTDNSRLTLRAQNSNGISIEGAADTGIFVQNSGNVGIGTTSPGYKLHITGGGDAGLASGGFLVLGETSGANLALDNNEIMARNNGAKSALYIQNDGGDVIIGSSAISGINDYLYVTGYDTGAGATRYGRFNVDAAGDFNIEAQSGEVMRFITGGADRITLDNSGNVGVGTTGPDSKLDVLDASNPQLQLTQTDSTIYTTFQVAATTGGLTITTVGGTDPDITLTPGSGGELNLNGSTIIFNQSAIFSPAGSYTITGLNEIEVAQNSSASDPGYTFTNDTNTGMYTSAADVLGFSTAGVEVIRISSAQLVGIGTTNPVRKLDVADNSSATAFGVNQAGSGWVANFTKSSVSKLLIDSSGNIGIGTTTVNYALDVAGQVNASTGLCIAGDCKTTWTGAGGYTASNGLTLSGTDFQLGGSLTQATGIDIAGQNFGFLGGNVGIGTSSPAATLDISSPATTGNALQLTGNSLTTGKGIYLYQNDSMFSGQALSIELAQSYNAYAYYFDGATYTDRTNVSNAGWVGAATLLADNSDDAFFVGNNATIDHLVVDINTVASPALTLVVEYASGVDGSGNVNAWTAFSDLSDGTSGFTVDGTISWTDPGASWVTGKVNTKNYKWLKITTTTAIVTPPTTHGIAPSLSKKNGTSFMKITDGPNIVFNFYKDSSGGPTFDFKNGNFANIGHVQISDPGYNEGLGWSGTSGNWYIDVTPLDRSNADGNLNFYNSSSNNIALWRPALFVYNASNYTTLTPNSDGGSTLTTTGTGVLNINPSTKFGGNVGIGASASSSIGVLQVGPAAAPAAFFVGANGNVGIGTTSPEVTLEVSGSVRFDCTTASTWTTSQINPSCSDYAEVYQTTDASLEPGDVIALDIFSPAKVNKSGSPYQKQVIGVYSTSPGVLIGPDGIISASGSSTNLPAGKIPVALIGRVPVKVSLENGPIEVGDYLTSSSKPGVAMKATKAGSIIGKALEAYHDLHEGKIMIFVSSGEYNGSSIQDILGGLESGSDFGKMLLSKFIDQQSDLMADKDLSEILTDRLAAGLEIITPKVITNTLSVGSIKALQDDIVLNLTSEGKFIIKNEASESAVTFDSSGNATFRGMITADTIRANQIQGLEVITDKISSLSQKVDGLPLSQIVATPSATAGTVLQASSSAIEAFISTGDGNSLEILKNLKVDRSAEVGLDMSVVGQLTAGGGLVVNGPAEFKEKSVFEALVEFFDNVIFHKDVSFEGRTTFNSDTAGSAVIKEDADSVDIVFDREYAFVPLVNVTLILDDAVDASASASVRLLQEASQSALERQVLDGDIRYIVTKRSVKGFTVKINKPAVTNLTFSWSALAVKNAKTAVSTQLSVVSQEALGLESSSLPSVLSEATSSAVIEPIMIKINDNELGYLRVRDEATTTAPEVGQVLPGQTFQMLAEKDGWYEIEYKSEYYGWILGSYVTVQ